MLAVRPDNLGDVVMCGPALRALRAALAPGARLDLLCSPAGAAVAGMLPGVDGLLVERPVWQDASHALPLDPARELALVERLRGYDAAVVLTSFSQSPWPAATLAALAGVGVRAGQSTEFGGSLLTHWVAPPPDAAHQVDRQLHLLAALGVPSDSDELHLDVPARAHEAAAEVLAERRLAPGTEPGDDGPPLVVVLPGASCPSRRWEPMRFADVARRLADDGAAVAVAGSDRETDLVDGVVAAAGDGVHGLAGALDVPGLAALLARADVVLTGNSGGMHLADAVGTPAVVLFAGTEQPSQYEPRGLLRRGAARLFTVPVDCAPCRAFSCPYCQECLDVDPAEVADAARALLAAGRPVAV